MGGNIFRSRSTGLWNPVNHAAAAPASEGGEVDFRPLDSSPDRKHVPETDIVKKDEDRFFKLNRFKEI